jgi:hypothetical protein
MRARGSLRWLRRGRRERVEDAQREAGAGGRLQRTRGRPHAAREQILHAAALQCADQPADALAIDRSVPALDSDNRSGGPAQREVVHAGRILERAARHRQVRFDRVDVDAIDRQIVGEHPAQKGDLLDG